MLSAKKLLTMGSWLVLMILVAIPSISLASEFTGTVSTGVGSSGVEGIVITDPDASPSAGTYSSSRSVTLSADGSSSIIYTTSGSTPTCSSGTTYSGAISVSSTTTIKAIACYPNDHSSDVVSFSYTISSSSGGGGGGGGGGGSSTTTTTITTPTTTTPKVITPTPTITDTSSPTVVASDSFSVEQMMNEAQIVNTGLADTITGYSSLSRDAVAEKASYDKYLPGLSKNFKGVTQAVLDTVNYFVWYGTPSTKKLGAGERAGVVSSYGSAYGRLPSNTDQWLDAIKIGSGRWPTERNTVTETQAAVEFKKVYARVPNLTNNLDQNAIMVIAYGLRPSLRNSASEKIAIKSFKFVYAHAPVNPLAWNIVRAIAYSGTKR